MISTPRYRTLAWLEFSANTSFKTLLAELSEPSKAVFLFFSLHHTAEQGVPLHSPASIIVGLVLLSNCIFFIVTFLILLLYSDNRQINSYSSRHSITWQQANAIKSVERSGYISPEYAMEGKFSDKSDVFSFGVLVLEIVSGRRNSSFVDDEWSMNLLGYVR